MKKKYEKDIENISRVLSNKINENQGMNQTFRHKIEIANNVIENSKT